MLRSGRGRTRDRPKFCLEAADECVSPPLASSLDQLSSGERIQSAARTTRELITVARTGYFRHESGCVDGRHSADPNALVRVRAGAGVDHPAVPTAVEWLAARRTRSQPGLRQGDQWSSRAAVIVVTSQRRPDRRRYAATDPDAVDAFLRPQLGRRLCMVRSRGTRPQLDAVHGYLTDRWGE
jgi:hypothetical protein